MYEALNFSYLCVANVPVRVFCKVAVRVVVLAKKANKAVFATKAKFIGRIQYAKL